MNNNKLSFLESYADETPSIGGFSIGREVNGFDECFKEA